MFRKIEDFEKTWKYETEETLKLFATLTDESLAQKDYDGGRTLGFLAGHLVSSMGMVTEAGLDVGAPSYESEVPKTAAEIVKAFKESAERVGELVAANWTDETLLEETSMYGEMWKRGFTLMCMISHLAHHRGQITVLMRQAGLKVHGVYGPAKEEWAAMGMPAMA
jgi:uncharacterized damage-inducible protein DinB